MISVGRRGGSDKERGWWKRMNDKGVSGDLREIYFAGGCFWGVGEYFSRIPGVREAVVGYANGRTERPAYEEVCHGGTGHAEAVRVVYDSSAVGMKTLARQFFKIIDPTSLNRQGNDVGIQYRTGIYYTDPRDRPTLEEIRREVEEKLGRAVVTQVQELENFFPAEEYHQDYLKKNPQGYCHIDFSSLEELEIQGGFAGAAGFQEPKNQEAQRGKGATARYVKPPIGELRKRLTPAQLQVTQNGATERPFTGEYWDCKEEGLYVDIVTGQPLFLSSDKFDSGCGWPSFTRPATQEAVTEKRDLGCGMDRVEVRSGAGDSHLGHVFADGPADRGGLRYCINSAALRFVPYERLEEAGYGEWKERFDFK